MNSKRHEGRQVHTGFQEKTVLRVWMAKGEKRESAERLDRTAKMALVQRESVERLVRTAKTA